MIEELLRTANALLALVCVVFMVLRLPALHEQPAPVALLLYTLGVFVAVAGYGSLEALFHADGGGPLIRVPMVTSALVLCLFGLSRFRPSRARRTEVTR